MFWGSITTGTVANATFATTANNALFANSASFVYGKQESQLSVANAVFATTANNALRFNGKQESQLDVSTANNATTFLSGRRWETAGAIGSTVANTGAFTTLTASANTTFTGNTFFRGGIVANSSLGANGLILTSNGTSVFWGSVSTSGPVANATFATTANNALFANSASFVYGKQESQLSVSTANNATTFLSGRRWETAGAIGATTANTGAFTTVSTTGTTTMSGGANSIVLSNATSNRIMWGAGGVAAPTFTSYSAGAKLVLSDSIAAASAGHAIGVETSTMWFGTSTNTEQFKWYGGTTNYMSSNTTGLTHTGNITAYSSDKRLKKNITLIENAIDKVQQIGGYTFDWDKELCDKYEFIPGNIHEHGVIAQEIEKIIPDAVTRAPFDIGDDGGSKTGENYLTVRYDRIVPLLIEAIKDQQTQIDELKELVKTLINRDQNDG